MSSQEIKRKCLFEARNEKNTLAANRQDQSITAFTMASEVRINIIVNVAAPNGNDLCGRGWKQDFDRPSVLMPGIFEAATGDKFRLNPGSDSPALAEPASGGDAEFGFSLAARLCLIGSSNHDSPSVSAGAPVSGFLIGGN